jgi:hypothetical protein
VILCWLRGTFAGWQAMSQSLSLHNLGSEVSLGGDVGRAAPGNLPRTRRKLLITHSVAFRGRFGVLASNMLPPPNGYRYGATGDR